MRNPRLVAHVAAAKAARITSCLFFAAAFLAAAADLKGATLALVIMGLAFRMADPGPDPDLDRVTGR